MRLVRRGPWAVRFLATVDQKEQLLPLVHEASRKSRRRAKACLAGVPHRVSKLENEAFTFAVPHMVIVRRRGWCL